MRSDLQVFVSLLVLLATSKAHDDLQQNQRRPDCGRSCSSYDTRPYDNHHGGTEGTTRRSNIYIGLSGAGSDARQGNVVVYVQPGASIQHGPGVTVQHRDSNTYSQNGNDPRGEGPEIHRNSQEPDRRAYPNVNNTPMPTTSSNHENRHYDTESTRINGNVQPTRDGSYDRNDHYPKQDSRDIAGSGGKLRPDYNLNGQSAGNSHNEHARPLQTSDDRELGTFDEERRRASGNKPTIVTLYDGPEATFNVRVPLDVRYNHQRPVAETVSVHVSGSNISR